MLGVARDAMCRSSVAALRNSPGTIAEPDDARALTASALRVIFEPAEHVVEPGSRRKTLPLPLREKGAL
jgi:hypothetical protein